MGLTNQKKNYIKHVQPLLDAQFLEFTKPEKADVKGQKYILSTFGRELKRTLEE